MIERKTIRSLTLTSLITALLCVSALIYIPMTVPITLQTLVLFLSLFVCGGKLTAVSVAVYIAIGAIGLPVFSGFSGGVGKLFDATGGFIFGMLAASLLWCFLERMVCKISVTIMSTICIGVIYITGGLWYAFVYLEGAASIPASISVSIIPFIVPDILKIYIAYIISKRVSSVLANQGLI